MYLSHVHIDGFGVLSGQTITDLPQGCSIFLGHNEAGKSTCLDFLRVALTGYPDPRSKEAKDRPYAPLRGGHMERHAPGNPLQQASHRPWQPCRPLPILFDTIA